MRRRISNKDIPLINDNNELLPCSIFDSWERIWQTRYLWWQCFRINRTQFAQNWVRDKINHIVCFNTVCQKPLYIDMNQIIFIQMLLKIYIFADFQTREHFLWICTFAIISRKHISCIRLSEPARSTIANISICRIQNAVCVFNQTRFVNVDFRI